MSENKSIALEILNESYNIKSDIPEQELLEMSKLLNDKMVAIQEKQPSLYYKTIAVLAGLELAREYLALRKEHASLSKLLKDEKLLF